MQLIYEVEAVLQAAGFRVARTPEAPAGLGDRVLFEDDTLLGFVVVLPSVPDVVAQWRNAQDDYLRTHAVNLRRDPLKAWTTYSVFMTAAPVEDASALLEIEADVAATRKIARGGILTQLDVRAALAPLLPLAGVSGTSDSVESALLAKLSDEEGKLFELVREPAGAELRVMAWLNESAS